ASSSGAERATAETMAPPTGLSSARRRPRISPAAARAGEHRTRSTADLVMPCFVRWTTSETRDGPRWSAPSAVGEELAQDHEATGLARARLGGEELEAHLAIAEAIVERKELAAQIDHQDVALAKASPTQPFLRGFHEATSEAAALSAGPDGEEPEVAAALAPPDVDAARDPAILLRDEEGSAREVIRHLRLVRARSRDEEPLDG